MTIIPSCAYCKYFNVDTLSCKKNLEIPKDILNGKIICKDVKYKDAK